MGYWHKRWNICLLPSTIYRSRELYFCRFSLHRPCILVAWNTWNSISVLPQKKDHSRKNLGNHINKKPKVLIIHPYLEGRENEISTTHTLKIIYGELMQSRNIICGMLSFSIQNQLEFPIS